MEASTDYFLSLVECNRIIYDKTLKDFKNGPKKDEAWARIAKISKMTVEAAKKRYTGLRQKYCREKQKMELQRRTKSNPIRTWIFHERMQFLDEFIQPRSTYSNDTGYGDIDGSSFVRGDDTSMTLAEEHEMDSAGMNRNGLDDDGSGIDNIEKTHESDEGIVSYNNEDVQDFASFQLIDMTENNSCAFLSEYSGELTTFHPADTEVNDEPCTCTPRDATANLTCSTVDQVQHNREEAATTTTKTTTTTTTSTSATRDQSLPAQATRNLSSSSQNASNLNNANRNNLQTLTQKSGSTLRKSANTKSAQNPTSTLSTQIPQTSLSSNDQSMEAMKQKLDSCISSLSTKISEKHQRSPHAPFLAYLGTKLPNVPTEGLGTLEKQILDLVDSFSQ